MDSRAAFPESARVPKDSDLSSVLGPATAPLRQVLDALRRCVPTATSEWKYSSRSGWYQIHSLKKRRLLYVIPQRGDFRISLILGATALEKARQGAQARAVDLLLKTAPRYPEGTAFSFDRQTLNPALLSALLAAKVST